MDFVATTRKYIVPFSKYLKIQHAGNCHPGQVFLAPVHFKDMTFSSVTIIQLFENS